MLQLDEGNFLKFKGIKSLFDDSPFDDLYLKLSANFPITWTQEKNRNIDNECILIWTTNENHHGVSQRMNKRRRSVVYQDRKRGEGEAAYVKNKIGKSHFVKPEFRKRRRDSFFKIYPLFSKNWKNANSNVR